jgi:hypothetical protein
MDRIHIFDNLLNEPELSQLIEYVNSQNGWRFGHSSGDSERIQTKFWSIINLTDYISLKLTTKIENIISSKFVRTPEQRGTTCANRSVGVRGITEEDLSSKVIKINRNYMHIQTFGQDGCYHIDDTTDTSFTICLYLTDLSNHDLDNAKGEFLIKIPNTKQIVSIDTQCNRCVLFPSNYQHKGMAYNHLYSNKRVCITWKCENALSEAKTTS